MSVNIEMPKLSDTMTEGTLVKWHKQVGDSIEIGDILADIETDKATMEMEAFDDGVLTAILIQEGEKTPIGSILAVLNGDAENVKEVKPFVIPSSPEIVPAQASQAVQPVHVPHVAGERIMASPLARRMAAEQGLKLAAIPGTGPAGRIMKSDVEAASQASVDSIPTMSSEATSAAALTASIKAKVIVPITSPTGVPVSQAIFPVVKADDEIIELGTIRKVIASRLLISKTTIPHFYLHMEVDVLPLMSLRRQINEQVENTHGNKYSVNDFILKAAILACQKVPTVNASFAGDHIVKFKHIGISVSISVDDGLVTPVIKEAETKSLLDISREVKDFAIRAKAKKLKPNEFDGGTITVSNLGAWGIESFDAIINPPQAIILTVGAAVEKPVVKNNQIVPGLRMNLGIACDHRVIDGAVAAQFLSEIKKLIEKPIQMLI